MNFLIGKPWYRADAVNARRPFPISRMGWVHFGSLFFCLPLGGYLTIKGYISPAQFFLPYALWFIFPLIFKMEKINYSKEELNRSVRYRFHKAFLLIVFCLFLFEVINSLLKN